MLALPSINHHMGCRNPFAPRNASHKWVGLGWGFPILKNGSFEILVVTSQHPGWEWVPNYTHSLCGSEKWVASKTMTISLREMHINNYVAFSTSIILCGEIILQGFSGHKKQTTKNWLRSLATSQWIRNIIYKITLAESIYCKNHEMNRSSI